MAEHSDVKIAEDGNVDKWVEDDESQEVVEMWTQLSKVLSGSKLCCGQRERSWKK